ADGVQRRGAARGDAGVPASRAVQRAAVLERGPPGLRDEVLPHADGTARGPREEAGGGSRGGEAEEGQARGAAGAVRPRRGFRGRGERGAGAGAGGGLLRGGRGRARDRGIRESARAGGAAA